MKRAAPANRPDALGAARARARNQLHTTRSLMLGTIDAAGMLLVSYAPFAPDDSGDLLIAVSALAAHQPALASADRVSVMLIEDEAAARQVFARTRLTLDCEIKPSPGVARREVFAALRGRFGEIADLLEGLGDFHAYRLTPRRGLHSAGRSSRRDGASAYRFGSRRKEGLIDVVREFALSYLSYYTRSPYGLRARIFLDGKGATSHSAPRMDMKTCLDVRSWASAGDHQAATRELSSGACSGS